MKVAISGKGGVGKTTFAAFMIRSIADLGFKVLAIDADPDANLAHALGIKGRVEIVPVSDMKELIEERTETRLGGFGSLFKLNPKVDDLPDSLSIEAFSNVRLMVMGGVKKGGSGCVCPESTLIKNLVRYIVLQRNEAVVMDMEAGLEHLGRGTSMAVDRLIVVVEPGRRSIDTAFAIKRLAQDLKINRLSIVGNKIRNEEEKRFLENELAGFSFLGFLPYRDEIVEADLENKPPFETDEETLKIVKGMVERLLGDTKE